MKTKYKILIASILVLSMLTAFAVTSFAAEDTSPITYDNNTYSYNSVISPSDPYKTYLQVWDYDTITFYMSSGTPTTYDYDYLILRYYVNGQGDIVVGLYSDTFIVNYNLDGYDDLNVVLTGNYKYGIVNSSTYSDNVTNICDTQPLEYDVWFNSSISGTNQINFLNNKQPSPLEKVNDFLGYLSTSLTKLTTMIITNQILILFIVAVPVVSFVIGSFKRIKDAGRA